MSEAKLEKVVKKVAAKKDKEGDPNLLSIRDIARVFGRSEQWAMNFADKAEVHGLRPIVKRRKVYYEAASLIEAANVLKPVFVVEYDEGMLRHRLAEIGKKV